jgi:RNA polymerase sigma-70 factor (ECF subfamily)
VVLQTSDIQADFIRQLTAAQPRLFRYVATLLGDVHDANNVLQETNVVLWSKADQFRPGSNFFAWAREVAYLKAVSLVRDRNRDRLIVDHALVEHAFQEADAADDDERRIALRHCMTELDDRQLQLLRLRYAEGASMDEIAQRQSRTAAAVKMALKRLRTALMGCIKRRTSLAA